ncbi:MAG: sulfate transporter CysZ [Gammaproteobacteria bacterium]|nr:sulfate transporter CysZ [Gammaproteobacteria bacterium]
MNGDIKTGFMYFIKGIRMLNTPGIRLFVIIPLLLNTVIFFTFISLFGYYFVETLDQLISKLPEWLSFLYWVIFPLFVSLLLIMSGYFFNTFINILGAPFNGFLAQKTEELLTQSNSSEPTSFKDLIAIIPHSLKREIDKIRYYIPRVIVLFILALIPGVNILSPFAWFVMGAWMLSIQYSDFPMDNNKVNFGEMKTLLAQKRLTSIGFGIAVVAALSIPVINFLVMPAAVIGATIMWVDIHRDKSTHQPVPQ